MKKTTLNKITCIICILLFSSNIYAVNSNKLLLPTTIPTHNLHYKIISFFSELFSYNDVESKNQKINYTIANLNRVNNNLVPIITPPGDTTIECDESILPINTGTATGSGSCVVDITYSDSSTQTNNGSCSDYSYTITRTWRSTETSCGGAFIEDDQTITVQDIDRPTWTTAANFLDRTVDCDDATALANAQALAPTATDNCDVTLTPVKTTGTFNAGSCPQAGTYTNTWTVSDDCSNAVLAVYTQTITVQDIDRPTWTTAANFLDRTVDCDDATALANAQALAPTATDNCDVTLTPVKTTGTFNAGSCPQAGTYTNTWTVSDDCSNAVLAVYTQTITVQDIDRPTWTTAANFLDRTVDCDDATALANAQALAPTATDNCDVTLTPVKTTGTFNAGSCPQAGTYTNTWTVSDDCSNAVLAVYTQTITVQDIDRPTWTTAANFLDRTVDCDDATALANAQALAPTATDNCDVTLTPVKTTGTFNAGSCPQAGTYTNTWTVSDDCSNAVLAVYTQTITVQDIDRPTWTTAANFLDRTVDCDDATALANAQALAPTATDNCDVTLTPVKTTGTFNAGSCPQAGTYTNTWTVSDDCSNAVLAVYTQTITVQDIDRPTWTTAANFLDRTVDCDDATALANAQALAPTATDNCDVTLTPVKTTGTFNAGSCPQAGTYTNTWTVSDDCSNAVLAVYTQTITVQDIDRPTWTTAANFLDRTVDCDDATALANAQALAPTATDNCDVTLTPVKTTGTFNAGSCPQAGTYTNTWTVSDDCSNAVLAVYTQTITVQDIDRPTWTTAANFLDRTVDCDDATALANAQALAPTATDNCDVTLTPVKTTGTFNAGSCPQAGTYTNTWTVSDDCSNAVLAVYTQTITVQDIDRPTWTTAANFLDRTVDCDDATALANAQALAPTATDNCDVTLTPVKTTGTFNAGSCPQAGTYTNTWTVSDDCSNAVLAVYTQTITVQDIDRPTWTTAANFLDRTVDCDDATALANAQALAPTATDNCDVTLTPVKTTGTFNAGSCPQAGTYTNTWTVSDDCSNAVLAVYTQTITVEDDTNPTFNNNPGNLTPQCTVPAVYANYAAFVTAGGSATDNCGIDTASFTHVGDVSDGNTNPEEITRTYSIDDNCGNTVEYEQTITVEDTTPPTAVCQDITVQLVNGMANINPININNGSFDNCGSITLISVSPNTFGCTDVGANTVTLTVEDSNGLQNTCTATVTVEDNQAPTAVCIPNNSLTLSLDPITGIASITAAQIDNGSSDHCGIASMSVNPSVLNCNNVGNPTVTLTVTDVNGNSSNCSTTVVVDPPTISTGAITGFVVVTPPDTPEPADDLIEVTACPDGIAIPKTVNLTLDLTGSNINASNISAWQTSGDQGGTWTDVALSSGQTNITLSGLLTTTLVRAYILSGNCPSISPYSLIRFLPPDEPPIIESITNTTICLGDDVDVVASSFFEYGGQFGGGGYFNQANPDGWRVDGVEFLPAPGNNTNPSNWFETNGPRIFGGIRYDTSDNTKFAVANGTGFRTTMETPIFSTIGMSSTEAILEFYQAYYFCNNAFGEIRLSTNGGDDYDIVLSTQQGDNLTSGNESGFSVLANSGGCGSGPQGQHPTSDPFQFASLDLSGYLNEPSLRIMFIYDANAHTSNCNNQYFPDGATNTCNNIPNNFDVHSTWVIDDVGFPYAPIDEILEWKDEFGNVIATGSNVKLTPFTPGARRFNVTALVNGCRADTDDGTEFVDVNTSLAYAGENFTPLSGKCGQSSVQLNAYDNTRSAYENSLTFDEHGNAAYPRPASTDVVPTQYYTSNDPNDITSVFDYPGTGVTGTWSIVTAPSSSCGSTATFSSNTNPRATFTGEPGTYTLRWTLNDSNACPDDVVVTITSCDEINFDGNDDYVTFKNNYNLNGSFSIEVWVKPEATTGTIFSRKDNAINNAGYDLSLSGGSLVFNFGSGSISTGNIINTTRWFHVAVTFDGSNYILYVDGVPIGNPVSGSAPVTTPNNIEAILGAIDQSPPGVPVNYFSGWMDEFRVWNRALGVHHIRQMMNQEINDLSGNVGGEVIPTKVYGVDTIQDNVYVEEDAITWSHLDGYYRMAVDCGYLTAYKGVSGRLRNITSSQTENAPIPYTTATTGTIPGGLWTSSNTWEHGSVWYTPNSTVHSTKIDWNIVQISDNVYSANNNFTVLGLIVDSGAELSIQAQNAATDANNAGQSLWVTHYLALNGTNSKIDLEGESQLIQRRYGTIDSDYSTIDTTIQFNESVFEQNSTGYIERDQQGTANNKNYNYWSSPVNDGTNNYSLSGILRNGANADVNPMNNSPIIWDPAHDGIPTPITLSTRWTHTYKNIAQNATDNYYNWERISPTTSVPSGYGFIMKGSTATTGSVQQNYVFVGKPNNETIAPPIAGNNLSVIGNPYPSAINAHQFLRANSNASGSYSNSTQSITGELYFWDHYVNNNTHITELYEGGYAIYNFVGGLEAVQHPYLITVTNPDTSRRPEHYIPIGQSFFVVSSNETVGSGGSSGYVEFKNNMREYITEADPSESLHLRSSGTKGKENTNNNSPDKTDNTGIKRIRLDFRSTKNAVKHLLLGFSPNNEATDGYDMGWDAYSWDYLPNDMAFLIEGNWFSIQGVGRFDDSKRYPLDLYITDNGEFQISLTGLENFANNEKPNVYVYDALLDTYSKINNENFKMPIDANYYTGRFYITFKKNKALYSENENIDEMIVNYLNYTREIYINVPNDINVKHVHLFNILGQKIISWDDKDNSTAFSSEFKLPVKRIADGTYIVKVETQEGKTINKKVIIKQY